MGPSIGTSLTGDRVPFKKYAALLHDQSQGSFTNLARTGLLCMYSSFSIAFLMV